MKKLLSFILFSFCLLACSRNAYPTENNTKSERLTLEPNDDGDYDIIVFDPEYETYLRSIAMPKDYYSTTFYKNKNTFYVASWNNRHAQPFAYNPDLYAVHIEYDSSFDYGLLLEYKLYNFFKFIEWKYKVRL